MTQKQAEISSCCWREVSRKRGSHSLILHIVLQNTIETMLASFNYLSVHCKGEQLMQQYLTQALQQLLII